MSGTARWSARLSLVVGAILLTGSLGGCDASDSLEQVRELQARGRYQESLETLRELLVVRPDEAEIHYRHGLALRHTGRSEMAVWSLRKAREDPDWAVIAGLELAGAAVAGRNWATAIEEANLVLERVPDSLEAFYLRGEARLGEKSDPASALADFDRALELAPNNVKLELSRVAALLLLDEIEAAGATIERLESLGQDASIDASGLGHLCVMKATFASESNEAEQAEALFAECLGRYPTHGIVLQEALAFFDGQGRPEQANEILRAALEQVPHAVIYRDALATRLRAAGDPAEAEAVLRAGLDPDGNPLVQADTWVALANHFDAVDDQPTAANAYERALEYVSDPSALQVLTLADLWLRAGRLERALEVAQELDPDTYRDLIEARVDLERGRPAEALARLERVLPLWPNNAGARYYAARAAEQVGDFDRAIEEYRQAIRSSAGFTDAGLRLGRLHVAEGEEERAWSAASHHYRALPDDAEGALFLVELAGRLGPESRLRNLLLGLRKTRLWAQVVAARAEAAARRDGPEAAIELLGEIRGLEFTRPRDAAALRALVRHQLALGQTEHAQQRVAAALAAHPEEAAFHEIQALVLRATEAPPEAVRAAYERALELDARHIHALEGLAALAQSTGDVPAALAYYDRVTEATPERLSAFRAAAELVAATGEPESAERRWEALLREHPWDAAGALALAELQLSRDGASDGTLELARRAVRFGGGPAARRVLSQVHLRRGETELAAEVLRDLGERS